MFSIENSAKSEVGETLLRNSEIQVFHGAGIAAVSFLVRCVLNSDATVIVALPWSLYSDGISVLYIGHIFIFFSKKSYNLHFLWFSFQTVELEMGEALNKELITSDCSWGWIVGPIVFRYSTMTDLASRKF